MKSEKLEISEKEEAEYNPLEHRDLENGISYVRSVANLIKSSLGSGLLAMPLAFSNAGWVQGLVSTIIISFICTHCLYILVNTSRECCRLEKIPMLGYAETCESVFKNGPPAVRKFSKAAKIFANCSTTLTYLAICCVYIILISDSIKQILDRYLPEAVWQVELYCLVLLVPLAIISQVRNLKWLAPFSIVATIFLTITFVICLYYIFSEDIDVASRKAINDVSRYPAFLSTVIFALEGVGVVMPTENGMKKPQHFLGYSGVLVVAMAVITFLYSTLGLFGYLRFGDDVKGSVTLNLPLDDLPAIIAKVLIILAIFFTYPLQFYVCMDILWKYSENWFNEKHKSVIQIILRALVVCLCGAISVSLPLLEQIIGIVGALFFSILGIIIPAVLETTLFWGRLGRWNWILWKNILVFTFGIVGMSTGCAVTVSDMISILNSND